MIAAPVWRARLARALPALRLARFVLAVAVVAAMGVFAVRDAPSGPVRWWLFAPALVATGIWWLLLARGWSIVAAGRTSAAEIGMWCRTQVLRYLPGGIWAPTSRVVLVGGTVADRVATVAAENVVALCAALTIGGVALAAGGGLAWVPLVALAPAPVLAARLTRGRTRLSPERVARATVNGIAAFACYVAAAVLVQGAVSGLHRPLLVAGAAAVSWGAGLVVVIAPGGVGIRELVYVGLLTASFRRHELVAGAVLLRAVTIGAELIVLLAVGRPRRGLEALSKNGGGRPSPSVPDP